MTGPISDDRAAIIAALPASAGTGYVYVPDRIYPPAALALSAGMDRKPSDPVGSWTGAYDVWLIMSPGPNETVTDRLDTVLWDAICALHREGFVVDGFDPPFTYQVQNQALLAVIIHTQSGLTAD